MIEQNGWLLDLYPGNFSEAVLWFLAEDGSRSRFTQSLPATFFAAGPPQRLRALWKHLKKHHPSLKLFRHQRRDIFQKEPVTVLAVEVPGPVVEQNLFNQVSEAFPDLTYYDTDIPIFLRHAAAFSTFPLAYCRISAQPDGRITSIVAQDTPWDIDPSPAPLRILTLELDNDPRHAEPAILTARYAGRACDFPFADPRPLLVNLAAILRQHDPDILLTTWGDNWLLPRLLQLAEKWHIELPLSRDPERTFEKRTERSYFSYGQVIHRDQQIHLFGRCHIDAHNAMLFHDYGLEGIYELARVTSLPLQTVARVSPGSGISAMQMVTALRQQVLVPWHKQQAERYKTAADLMRADQGGMVYQPIIGLHHDVAELDFSSMYPSIIVHQNISPETMLGNQLQADKTIPGLIPQTLEPLLNKRMAIKKRLSILPRWETRRKAYKARSSAHKWLLVTCFGYLGYKNARFGRIESHEAVTAYGREALLHAKEAAEDLGYTVLHLYVDGLWVKKEGACTPATVQPLLDEITRRTGLPIALEGIYRWVAFLPSRQDSRAPVANRYFGVFQDGSTKARGIEFRRHDTPRWVAEIQAEILAKLARFSSTEQVSTMLPEIAAGLRKNLRDLRLGRVPLQNLVVTQKLSRNLEEYRSSSPSSCAATQLACEGKLLRPGQMVRFLYMLGLPGVHAWDLLASPDPTRIQYDRYSKLLLRAAGTLLEPFGVDERTLHSWIFYHTGFRQETSRPMRLFSLAQFVMSKYKSGQEIAVDDRPIC